MWLSLRKIFQRQPPSSDAALTLELLEVLEECDTKQQVVVSQQLRRLLVVNVTHCEREVTLVKTKDVTQLVHRACSLEIYCTYGLCSEKLTHPNMKILGKDELLAAETALQQHLPKALKVFGYIHGLNRNKPCKWEVVVDTWPNFKAIVCRPNSENQPPLPMMSFFSADEKALREFLEGESSVDWSSPYIIAGIDAAYTSMLKEVCSKKKVDIQQNVLVHLMHLPDSMDLTTSAVVSEDEFKISSLNSSHVDLVNNTWKFGGNSAGYRTIDNLINNFPSSCITDKHGQPVAWILMYDYCAMGLLYTLPEHRGKGYAKILIGSMVKLIRTKGYPVYCYIEVDNEVSYRLFKKMGFINDPSYKAAWFEIGSTND